MSKHDDFLDDYIGYRIFEDSMKGSGSKPPKKNTGCGCGTWVVLICIAVLLLGAFGSCSKSSPSKKSSDPYDAKSYAHPDDFYYDYRDDFWDYEDAEEYWDQHQND